jgi:protoporphyrin/coproporphyrin ferrochelatase
VTAPIGVLVMAYGTAGGPEDVERYYTDIRGGRPPSPEHLAELTERYAAIGNRFPLTDITYRQAAALERELNEGYPGDFRVYVGMKHSPPFIPEAVLAMRAEGIERAVALVLAPHYSRFSVGQYIERIEGALAQGPGPEAGPGFRFVESYHTHPLFVQAVAAKVHGALEGLQPSERERAIVVFSAHSLPAKIVELGDPYPDQLRETADAVAAALALTSYTTGWQSAGRTTDPWLGPDITDLIPKLAADGYGAVVVCACGFVADHLEILYDLDIEARRVAEQAGIAFVRTESMNDDPAFIRALAAVVAEHLE